MLYRGEEGQIRDFALRMIARRAEVLPAIEPQLVLPFLSKSNVEAEP
jgi:hypothetical protein